MKYNLFSYFLPLLTICISCGNGSKKKDNVSFNIEKKTFFLQQKDLQGVWSENKEDNALFFIQGDSLWYVENQEIPFKIEISNDTLIVLGSPPFYCKIITLNEDSLCYIDNITNEVTRLVKIK